MDEPDSDPISLSFIDLMSCGLGAVLLLFLGLAIASHVGTISGISHKSVAAGSEGREAARGVDAPDDLAELVRAVPVILELVIEGLDKPEVAIVHNNREVTPKKIASAVNGAVKFVYLAIPERNRKLRLIARLKKTPVDAGSFLFKMNLRVAGRFLAFPKATCPDIAKLSPDLVFMKLLAEGEPSSWPNEICGERK
jgi:hypothetical protein